MSPDSEPRPPALDEGAALRAIVEGIATATGEAFFAAQVMNLTLALGTQGAWVTEYLDILGFLGLSPTARKGSQGIRVTMWLKSDAPAEKLAALSRSSPAKLDNQSPGRYNAARALGAGKSTGRG